MKTKKLKEFDRGILVAVSLLIYCHNSPVIATDVLLEAALSDADVSTLEEFDKHQLRKLNEESSINLKGL